MMETISNYKTTQRILSEFNLNAKKRFGQNFIIDPSVVVKIAQNCGATQATTVIEIGPGLGALTQQLALVANKVVSYEIDDDMVQVLTQTITDNHVTIIHQDFLEADLQPFEAYEDLVVCANVPYYITTPILFKLIESPLKIKQLTLMVQREVAQRLSAKVNSKKYNALSVMMDILFTIKTLSKVPAACFYPQPRVDSSVVMLITNELHMQLDLTDLFQFIKTCFVQRRKTLINNLKGSCDLAKVEQWLTDHHLSLTIRAQELNKHQLIDLYRSLYEA